MKSMTGYGWAEEQNEEVSASVEIKGYNNRFLDMAVIVPPRLSALEIPVRNYLAERCRRGRIEVSFRYRECNAPLAVSLNREAAKAYWDAAEETVRFLGMADRPSLGLILGLEGVLEVERNWSDSSKAQERLMPLLEKAFEGFEADRQREGSHTYKDILAHLDVLENSRVVIASHSDDLEKLLKENIKTRFEELLGDRIDENRILAETAALLVKYTISEELSRLDAHLREFRAEAERNPSPGKKLDFLCQELNREINTIGSKAVILEVSRETVHMKDALENIREQLRNVE
jgi:uncharacterized protein (TIGR00255 family)